MKPACRLHLITVGEGGSLALGGVGSLLLIVTIPWLALGAHCLDLLEWSGEEMKDQPRARRRLQAAPGFRFDPRLAERQIREREQILRLIRARIEAGRL